MLGYVIGAQCETVGHVVKDIRYVRESVSTNGQGRDDGSAYGPSPAPVSAAGVTCWGHVGDRIARYKGLNKARLSTIASTSPEQKYQETVSHGSESQNLSRVL